MLTCYLLDKHRPNFVPKNWTLSNHDGWRAHTRQLTQKHQQAALDKFPYCFIISFSLVCYCDLHFSCPWGFVFLLIVFRSTFRTVGLLFSRVFFIPTMWFSSNHIFVVGISKFLKLCDLRSEVVENFLFHTSG